MYLCQAEVVTAVNSWLPKNFRKTGNGQLDRNEHFNIFNLSCEQLKKENLKGKHETRQLAMHVCNFLSKHFICSNATKTQKHRSGRWSENGTWDTQPTSKEQLLHFFPQFCASSCCWLVLLLTFWYKSSIK